MNPPARERFEKIVDRMNPRARERAWRFRRMVLRKREASGGFAGRPGPRPEPRLNPRARKLMPARRPRSGSRGKGACRE